MYPLYNNSLSRGLTLLSPAVRIESACYNCTSKEALQNSAQLYFNIDMNSFPTVLKMNEDICLGKIINID